MSATERMDGLVEAALAGDDVAVAELVRSTQPAVWRLCSALGSRGEVEDLVQETYLRALLALPSFRREASVEVWLLSIARRVCADDVRRRQRRRRLTRRLSSQLVQVWEAAPDITAQLVDELVSERREAFVLTQLIGLTYADAALVVGCPVGTIRSRVSRARADLLESMGEAESG